jgi:hypothetical protein
VQWKWTKKNMRVAALFGIGEGRVDGGNDLSQSVYGDGGGMMVARKGGVFLVSVTGG